MFNLPVANCCGTIISRQTDCLKPQSLLRSALSPARTSSPAVRRQWNVVDTPSPIHFKTGGSCFVKICQVGSHSPLRSNVKRCQTQSDAVKCFRLKNTGAWKWHPFSDKLINSPKNVMNTNYSMDPVPPASKGGQESPESPLKKTNRILRWKCGWSIELGKSWPKHSETMDFTVKQRAFLQIFPSDQRSWPTSWPKTSRKVVETSINGWTV